MHKVNEYINNFAYKISSYLFSDQWMFIGHLQTNINAVAISPPISDHE